MSCQSLVHEPKVDEEVEEEAEGKDDVDPSELESSVLASNTINMDLLLNFSCIE